MKYTESQIRELKTENEMFRSVFTRAFGNATQDTATRDNFKFINKDGQVRVMLTEETFKALCLMEQAVCAARYHIVTDFDGFPPKIQALLAFICAAADPELIQQLVNMRPLWDERG